MNEGKASYYKQNKDGYSVYFDGQEVANELTPEQAGQLLDDLSYYGSPMYCVYNRKELCMQGKAVCISCPDRKELEARKYD